MSRKMRWRASCLILLLAIALQSGCTVAPPDQPDDICAIFHQYPKWYWATQESQNKWGVPIPVQMAVMHQESHFVSKAKPPRAKLFGFIPWFRPSSAYGYTQALDPTWEQYEHESGNDPARRTRFADASDFVGWYLSKAVRDAGISQYNSYALYLAYHEGVGGYKRKTYLQKPWLMAVAKKVAARTRCYTQQLKQGEARLPRRHFWNIFL